MRWSARSTPPMNSLYSYITAGHWNSFFTQAPFSLTFLFAVSIAFPTGTVEMRCTGFLSFHVAAISSPFFLNREPPLGKFLTRGSLWSMISFGRSFRFGRTVPQAWIPCSLSKKEIRAGVKIVSKQLVAFILVGSWGKQQLSSFDSPLPPLCGQYKFQSSRCIQIWILPG